MGKTEFISIFNDVLGPVMRGPSSSHTAGGYRIARLAVSLLGRKPERVRCAFDPEGSYAPTYKPLGVDKAFCAGIIGMDMLDPAYDQAVILAARTAAVDFVVEPLESADHPNTMKIDFSFSDGSKGLTLFARSTGGGVVEIFRLNGWPVRISGKSRDMVLLLPSQEADRSRLRSKVREDSSLEWIDEFHGPQGYAAQIKFPAESSETREQLLSRFSFTEAWIAEPVFFQEAGASLFESAAEIAAYAKAEGVSLGEAGIAYESRILGFSRAESIAEMASLYKIMRASVEDGLNADKVHLAWLMPHAAQLMGALDTLPYGGIHLRAAARALAVMHCCNSRGILCAAPTGGSAGVLPGVLMTLEEHLHLSEDQVVRALFAAGLVGLIMAKRATFAAESAGCQVEIGVAGAMAAAAAVDAAGGSAEMALNAAAISLQNTMGMVCDPVGGGCEIPCHTRNAAAASAAFTNADLVLGGYPNPIPLDQTIDASYAVGKQLVPELRCTARGGLAITPAALSLVREHDNAVDG
jgi:L-serine dehydratase